MSSTDPADATVSASTSDDQRVNEGIGSLSMDTNNTFVSTDELFHVQNEGNQPMKVPPDKEETRDSVNPTESATEKSPNKEEKQSSNMIETESKNEEKNVICGNEKSAIELETVCDPGDQAETRKESTTSSNDDNETPVNKETKLPEKNSVEDNCTKEQSVSDCDHKQPEKSVHAGEIEQSNDSVKEDLDSDVNKQAPDSCSALLEQDKIPCVDSEKGCSEKGDIEDQVSSQLQEAKSESETIISPNDLTNSIKSSVSDAAKDKDMLARNVFDAFPLSLATESTNKEERLSQSSKCIVDNTSSIDSNEKQSEKGSEQRITTCNDEKDTTNTQGSETETLKKHNLLKKGNTNELKVVDTKNSNKEKSDGDTSKTNSRNNSKNKKEQKHNYAVSSQEKDMLQESEIIKKAKEKYNLKELRVSLHTADVKDCGEALSSVTVQNEKNNIKASKIKQANEQILSDHPSKAVKGPSEENANDSKSNEMAGQNKGTDQLHDNDSAKPLKKRGRRGYEDLTDCGNVDQEVPGLCDNKLEENSVVGVTSNSGTKSETEPASVLLNEIDSHESVLKVGGRKVQKGKKGKRSVKTANKTRIKKSLTSVVNKDLKVSEEGEESVTVETQLNVVDNNNTEILPDTTSETNSTVTSDTSQLKKYPGRSCKLRNQFPLIPLKPKKSKPSLKTKTLEHNSGNELKASVIDSPVKIKKKRKRKVKPWSWGNEKKKYKPKSKLPVEEILENVTESELKLPCDSSTSEQSVPDAVESGQVDINVPDVVCSVSKLENSTDVSTSDCTSSGQGENDASTPVNVIPEPKDLLSVNAEADSCDAECLVGKDAKKKSSGKRKKKDKKVRKPKSELKNNFPLLNENDKNLLPDTAISNASCEKTVEESSKVEQIAEYVNCVQDSEVKTSLISNENDLNENCTEQSMSNITVSLTENQGILAECSETFESNNSTAEVPKRKRGRPGRPKKGEGKGKSKKRKLETLVDALTQSTFNHVEEEGNDNFVRNQEVDADAPNEEHNDVIDAANLMEHVDNELPVDNYPHVSPDSGIQSLAGSPAGNESPNSVIINVENSINSSTSTSDSKQHSESVSKEKCTGSSFDGLESVPALLPELGSKDGELAKDCINRSTDEKTFETKNVPSDVQKPVEDNKPRKSSTSDSSKDAASCSPSKKKNRAKFLQLHKTSTLLQKGRLPTEEEKEKRLDDKFDYPEKVTDKLSASPPIDLYSQHMNSFQVTLGAREMIDNSLDILNKKFMGDSGETLHKSSSKKVGRKPRSKHKTKAKKNSSENSQNILQEKTSDFQEQTESLLCSSVSIARSISTMISDYSPIYHSSSVLTPISTTVSTVAMTDSVTTCSTSIKSISSVVETTSDSTDVTNTPSIQTETKSNMEDEIKTVPSVELGNSEISDQTDSIENVNLETQNSSVLLQPETVPDKSKTLKKKRGRTSSKHKKGHTVKVKPLGLKKVSSLSVNKFNLGVEKRSRGRPKGSKNKDKSLKEKQNTISHSVATDNEQADLDSNSKVGRTKRVLSPAKDNSSQVFSTEKVKKNKLDDGIFTRPDQVVEKASSNISNTMMAWRESSVLGHDNEDKKKRGPGRPRKHPKKPDVKKRDMKGHVTDSLNSDSIGKVSVDQCSDHHSDHHSEQISMDLDAGPMDEPPILEMFKDDDLTLLDESMKQLPKIRKSKLHPMLKKGKRGRKKGYTPKKTSDASVELGIDDEVVEADDPVNMTDVQPARSVSSHDSDTSGAGSSLGSKSFQVQMWMEFSKHKRRKNKQKLRYFRSKHKNIIDPVFIARVDCLIDDFPQLSISPPSETYLKVRPGEVPLPSIFKIVRINIKKKKKDKLFVFEKAKPLKSKNELELGPKDKIKLARKIGDHLMDLSGVSYQQHYNLPPKKRHKLFSGLGPDDSYSSAETSVKPEKRKAGRPRKVRPPSPEQSTSFSFGEVHTAKQGFQMGKEATETLASFASVAAQSCQSPNTSFSPEKTSPPFSPASPKHRDFRSDKQQTVKSTNRPEPSASTSYRNVPSSDKVNASCDSDSKSKQSSCNKCSELQASVSEQSYLDTKVNSPKVVNNIHLKRKVKRLKRKYRRSKKLTKIKRKVVRPVETLITNEDSLDLDSSVRSVCSESEPLPSFHLDKRKLDSDSETETVKVKRPKLFKKRSSDTVKESGDGTKVRKQTGPFNQKKKIYQKAGLYSDAYKDDEKGESKPATETYFTFDLPLHFGQHQVKNTITDFQLPHDVWWMHSNNRLPKKGDGKHYRSIRNNIYVDTRPASKHEAHSCSCRKPLDPNEKGCGEDCLNRLVYTECSADMCPCYDQCSNQGIQKHQFASGLQKFLTKDRGFGVRTSKQIKLGQLIVEYCGEVVSEQEFRRRMTEEYSQDRNHYCLNLDKGMVIDGYRKGNIARFVNHSCEPNCEMQKWTVEGVYHMCLFALRDVEPGEELVYDYNFQSFNHDAQQLCNCGSKECRGIIGGKKQWFNGQTKSAEKPIGKKTKHSKDKRKSKQKLDKMKDKNKKTIMPSNPQGLPTTGHNLMPPFFSYPIKPLLKKEKVFARKHSIFLVRNFDRIRGMKHDQLDQESHKVGKDDADYIKGTHFTKRDVFIAQLTALKTSRSMKTRRLTVAEEDTEVGKMARIAGVCKEIYSAISSAKDAEGSFLATDLYHLPSKKKHPRYYQVIDEPIDLTMMQKKILSGAYQSVEMFEKDMLKLFHNVEIYCGKKSEMGDKIKALRDVFSNAKQEGMAQIQELLGKPESQTEPQSDTPSGSISDVDTQVATPTTSISSESDISEISDNKVEWMQGEDDEEEIIRCICGIFKDEGLMIQCDKCYIWQHTDCMRVKGDVRNYLCNQCDPRPIDMEVELVPTAEGEADASGDGNRYFMTLMRDDMQIRLGSCVYVMKENQSRRNSYKKSGGLDKDRMDIFRIERMWKNRKGEKFAFGHMYILPHETFHEPNRKFFPNEVFRTPLYEMFHLDSITGYCCVLDLLTYCKGKPRGYKDEDLYICEYRMDKTLHLFYKISSKQRCSVNTRSYCFEMYEKRLNPKRTYSPHEVPEAYKRNWREKSSGSFEESVQEKKPVSDEEEDVPLVKVKIERRKEKRERVNKILNTLSKGKLSPSKKRTDLTYLLTD